MPPPSPTLAYAARHEGKQWREKEEKSERHARVIISEEWGRREVEMSIQLHENSELGTRNSENSSETGVQVHKARVDGRGIRNSGHALGGDVTEFTFKPQ